RDRNVTGVQTCALPIYPPCASSPRLLPVAQAVADPNGSADYRVLTKLRKVVDVVDIELWAYKEMVGDVELYADAAMDLKMVGATGELSLIRVAENITVAATLEVEFGVSPANTADQLDHRAFGI